MRNDIEFYYTEFFNAHKRAIYKNIRDKLSTASQNNILTTADARLSLGRLKVPRKLQVIVLADMERLQLIKRIHKRSIKVLE